MSTHNIGFYEDLTKIIIKYHQICTLFLLLDQHYQTLKCFIPEGLKLALQLDKGPNKMQTEW